jgi:catecholate siderophore receptor
VNQRLGDTVAARVNAVYHRNDVPGRDFESYERWGIAPAVTSADGPTQVTLAYVHQEDDNVPIYGVPYFKSFVNDGPLPKSIRATTSATATSTSRTPRSTG